MAASAFLELRFALFGCGGCEIKSDGLFCLFGRTGFSAAFFLNAFNDIAFLLHMGWLIDNASHDAEPQHGDERGQYPAANLVPLEAVHLIASEKPSA